MTHGEYMTKVMPVNEDPEKYCLICGEDMENWGNGWECQHCGATEEDF